VSGDSQSRVTGSGGRAATTCVLADDHPAILDSISRYLGRVGFRVVATARDGVEALAAVEQHRPAVCIADVRMPRLDGVELTRKIATASPATVVLIYTGLGDAGLLSDALDAGARGFVSKDAPLDDLVRAIDVVAEGGLFVDPVLGAVLATSRRNELHDRLELSGRARDVLRLLSHGRSYEEIGAELFISPETARTHAARAMARLGAHTRTEAVAIALRDGLID
jgi:DNA-binding NarL/FixJ family response regulator